MTSYYRQGEHDDLPADAKWNAAVATRNRNAERTALKDVARALTEQDVLAPAELDGLLRTNYDEYCRRVNEIERKKN